MEIQDFVLLVSILYILFFFSVCIYCYGPAFALAIIALPCHLNNFKVHTLPFLPSREEVTSCSVNVMGDCINNFIYCKWTSFFFPSTRYKIVRLVAGCTLRQNKWINLVGNFFAYVGRLRNRNANKMTFYRRKLNVFCSF